MHRLSPKYAAPHHLEPMLRYVRRYEEEPFEITFSVPPRHGKTETLLHVIPWVLEKHPDWTIGYITYGADLAHSKSQRAQDLAVRAGIRLRSTALHEWRTVEGGGLLSGGIGGKLTGYGLNLLIVDDPVKDRATAESAVYRQRAYDWFTSTAYTRLEPGGSVIVCGTRWHEDDLQGRLIAGDPEQDRDPWVCVNMPAISEDGQETALWPQRWPVPVLRKRQKVVGPYDWAALFQGRPRPKGGSVFGDVHFWSSLPRHFRIGIGLDLAYTEKTTSDWSVAVVGLYDPHADLLYIVDCIRAQVPQPKFKELLKPLREKYPTARWRFYGTGPELAAADYMKAAPNALRLEVYPPRGDKFVRATPYAASWNDAKVLLPSPEVVEAARARDPEAYSWLNPFLSVHKSFTGVKDLRDDDVDAGAAMHDAVMPLRGERTPTPELPSMARRM